MIATVRAIAPDLVTAQEGSRQSPPRYVASDGKKYWLKANPAAAGPGHNCLSAELVAGALGAYLGAAPGVAIVHLSSVAAMAEHQYMVGPCFGSLDFENAINIRQFRSRGIPIPVARLDPAQAGLAWAFQTWIGINDWQCLIDAGDGRVYSFDHEEWSAFKDPAAAIGDVVDHEELGDLGRATAAVGPAVSLIEAVSDLLIAGAIAKVPPTGRLSVPGPRLGDVATALVRRQTSLRTVMARWQR